VLKPVSHGDVGLLRSEWCEGNIVHGLGLR